jgi:hypothetical protein
MKDWRRIAEHLVKKYGGIPHTNWLVTHGYWGLYQDMRRNEQKYKHLPRTEHLKHRGRRKGYNRAKANKWVELAEKLAKANKGVLPSDADVMRAGYNALNSYIRRHPKLFEHLPREGRETQAQHWRNVAVQLAKQHNGIPPTSWLLKHGYKTFYNYMIRHAEQFSDLPRHFGIIRDAKGGNQKRSTKERD